MEAIFQKIYDQNLWQGKESRSGLGSDLAKTFLLRQVLPRFLTRLNVRSVLDAPCGDLHWLKTVKLNLDQYWGVDIVKQVIEQNKELDLPFAADFFQADITADDLPAADLVLSRDGLVHLSLLNIFRALEKFKRTKAKYLLTTHYPTLGENYEIEDGWWRPINLQLAPFFLPAPIDRLDEMVDGKELFLWNLQAVEINIEQDVIDRCRKISPDATAINLVNSELIK